MWKSERVKHLENLRKKKFEEFGKFEEVNIVYTTFCVQCMPKCHGRLIWTLHPNPWHIQGAKTSRVK